ncbi:MAG: transglycosylase SLT domain-containing protein, partial [Rhodanobacteraceae bacterium]
MPIDVLPRAARFCFALALVVLAGSAAAADRSAQRDQFRTAYAASARASPLEWKKLAAGLEDYPLYPYLEAAALRKNIAKAERADIERFLARWPDSLSAREVRESYLRELARRGDWKSFRAFWKESRDRDLRCSDLRARAAGGEKLDFTRDIEPLWATPRATPATCDVVFANARADGSLTDARVWDRVLESAAAGNPDTAAAVAALLNGEDRVAAERIIATTRNPATELAKAEKWTDSPRNRDAVAYGIARYARRDSA